MKIQSCSSILLVFQVHTPQYTHQARHLAKNVHHFPAYKHLHAHKHTKEEVDEGEDFSELTSRRLIHLSQPVTPTASLLPLLFPASLFSIKCQDWPFYNHICVLGSGIQMQSMSIRITGLLIERGEMVWAIFPIFILTLFVTHIYIVPKLGSIYSCLQVAVALLAVTVESCC